MPSIQKIKNKKGSSYRVIIRKKGLKPITKTFKLRQHASEFIDSVYSNNNLLNHLGSLNEHSYKDISIKYKISRYGSLERVPQSYESRLKYWDEYLDKKSIHQITKLDIQQGLDGLPSHLSPTTINKFKRAASAVFNFAINQDYLVHSPVRNIKSLKEPGGRLRYLSNEEKTSLLEACRYSHWDKLYLIVLMAITTGARKGELERLKWSDIDFDRGLAYVHQTKNGEPRVLPLTKQVLNELGRVGRDAELIFNSYVKPTKPYEFRKEWIKALKRGEIDDFRFHDLRHTCASYLAQNGASLLEIADVLGHKQIQMTKRYAHLCVSHKQKLIEKYFGEI
jgi:integrase